MAGSIGLGVNIGAASRDDSDGPTAPPDVAAQYREWAGSGATGADGLEDFHREAAETGYTRVNMRGVAGRVPVDTFFDPVPARSADDLAPVLALGSDDVVAYYGSGIGIVTTEERNALGSPDDFDDLQQRLANLMVCGTEDPCPASD